MSVQDEVPKSRVTLTYKNTVEGQTDDVDLPFRLLVMGDLSGGTSKDRALDLSERELRSLDGSNLAEVMKDLGAHIDIVVPNEIDPNEESMRVKIDIDSMKSFSPEEVAKQVPQVRSLVLLKKLLEEMQSNIANKKEFAQLINRLFTNKESVDKLKGELQAFETHKLLSGKSEGETKEAE